MTLKGLVDCSQSPIFPYFIIEIERFADYGCHLA